MPYNLWLPPACRQAGWKAKIHDFERLEPPHVTIYHKKRKWRLGLRDSRFLDGGDKWSQVEETVRETIESSWSTLCDAWDALHPGNPVSGEKDDDDQ
jgi:hypothetical protein